MEVEPRGDKLALALAKAVVNKLSNSLAVGNIKKRVYFGDKVKTKNLVETVQYRQKKRSRQLVTHSQGWRLRYWRTHGEKLKEVVLEILKTQ